MARRDREHELVPEERLEHDAAMPTRRADGPELELTVGDAIDDRLRVGDGQPHADVGMVLAELAEQERHDGAAGPGRRAELERAADRRSISAGDIAEQLLLLGQQLLRRRVQPQTRLSRLDAAARPVEQLRSEPLLERADLQADRGLRDPEPVGGLREALPLDDGAERC